MCVTHSQLDKKMNENTLARLTQLGLNDAFSGEAEVEVLHSVVSQGNEAKPLNNPAEGRLHIRDEAKREVLDCREEIVTMIRKNFLYIPSKLKCPTQETFRH